LIDERHFRPPSFSAHPACHYAGADASLSSRHTAAVTLIRRCQPPAVTPDADTPLLDFLHAV